MNIFKMERHLKQQLAHNKSFSKLPRAKGNRQQSSSRRSDDSGNQDIQHLLHLRQQSITHESQLDLHKNNGLPKFIHKGNENKENQAMRRVQSVHLKKNISQCSAFSSQRDECGIPNTEITNRTFQLNNNPEHISFLPNYREPFMSQQNGVSYYSSSNTTLHHNRLQSDMHRVGTSQFAELEKPQYTEKLYEIIERSQDALVQKQSIQNCSMVEQVNPEVITINYQKKGLKYIPSIEELLEASQGQPMRLNLDSNKLKSLSGAIFPRSLLYLSLQNNNIEKLELSLITVGAPKIRELNLSHNKLIQLGGKNAQLGSLRSMDLTSNLLRDNIIRELLKHAKFSKLKTLNVASNRISLAQTIQMILNTPSLHRTLRLLDCRSNLITGQLDLDMENNLRDLNLERNRLETLAITCQLSNLRKLSLSYNQLISIAHDGRTFLPRLSELSLRCNHLSQPMQPFVSLSPKLRHLDLAENQLTWFTLQSCSLERLDLDGNERLRIEDFGQLQLPRLKQLFLPVDYGYVDYGVLKGYFGRLEEVNGESVKGVGHGRSMSQGDIDGGREQVKQLRQHQRVQSQVHILQPIPTTHQRNTSLEFSLSQNPLNLPTTNLSYHNTTFQNHPSFDNNNPSYHHSIQQNNNPRTEEIFNSQVVRLGSSNGKQQHARRGSGEFISKRISYRSISGKQMQNEEPFQEQYHSRVQQEEEYQEQQPVYQERDTYADIIQEEVIQSERLSIGADTSRERVEEMERLQVQIQAIAQQYAHRGMVNDASKQILQMFEEALGRVKGSLKSHLDKANYSPEILKQETLETKVVMIPPQKTQFSTSRQNPPFIDYDHLITLLSTPLSLLITALTTRRPTHLCIPCNTATLLKEISEALGLYLKPFNLGKYVFQHGEETEVIDRILQALQPPEAQSNRDNIGKGKQLPALDAYVLKSKVLRDMLESEIVAAKLTLSGQSARDEWELVKELRTKVLARIQDIESNKVVGGVERRNGLIEEFQKIEMNQGEGKRQPTVVQSVRYLETSEAEEHTDVKFLHINHQTTAQALTSLDHHKPDLKTPTLQNYDPQSTFSQSSSESPAKPLPKQSQQQIHQKVIPQQQQDHLASALSELLLFARHPLRQITVDQAALTFTDELATTQISNAQEEYKLIKYLMGAINGSQYRVRSATKGYNYNRIQQMGQNDLTLVFGRYTGTAQQKEFLTNPTFDKELTLASSLVELDKQNSMCECLVMMIREEELVGAQKNIGQTQGLRYEDGVYRGKADRAVAVYYLQYDFK